MYWVFYFRYWAAGTKIYSDARNPNLTGEFTFKQVYRKDIPQIINFLTERTGDLKVPLKTNNALGKETVFGEIYTDYIVESTNENGETYYTFSVIPYTGGDESKTYNLSVKSDGSTAESAKIIVYYPTEDWLLNGNGNFSVFSGTAYTYSLDGDIESSVEYHKGMADLCNPDPCPDCQGPSNPPGNGGGTSGGGGGVGGNPPTGTGGPVAYPPYTPSSPTPGQSGTTGGGQLCYWTCIYNDEGECYKMECITVVSAPRLVNPCGGGGVVISNQNDPCKKAAVPANKANAIMKDTNVNPKLNVLQNHAFNSNTEYGMTVTQNSNGTYSAQDPFTSNDPGSVVIPAPTTGSYVANAHSHNKGGATPPSVSDFYNCVQVAVNHPAFSSSFTYSHDGSVFAFVVTNRQEATDFLAAYPMSTNWDSGSKLFNEETQLGKDFNDIYGSIKKGTFPNYSGSDQNDALETALAYVLEKYKTGISLAKQDASGNLKPVKAVPFEYTIPYSGGKKITAYKTEMCP